MLNKFEDFYSVVTTGGTTEDTELYEKRGNKAEPTDYARLFLFSNVLSSYFDVNIQGLLKSHGKLRENIFLYYDGEKIEIDDFRFYTSGIRPKFEMKSPLLGSTGTCIKCDDGIYEIEIGEMFQWAVSKDLHALLEEKLNNDELEHIRSMNVKGIIHFRNVYSYEGEEYCRVIAPTGYIKNVEVKLSNDCIYKSGDIIWFKLEPVKYLVCVDSGQIISKYIPLYTEILNEFYNDYYFERNNLKYEEYLLSYCKYSILDRTFKPLDDIVIKDSVKAIEEATKRFKESFSEYHDNVKQHIAKEKMLLEREVELKKSLDESNKVIANADKIILEKQKKLIEQYKEMEQELANERERLIIDSSNLELDKDKLNELREQIETDKNNALQEIEDKLSQVNDNVKITTGEEKQENIQRVRTKSPNRSNLINIPASLKPTNPIYKAKFNELQKNSSDSYGFFYKDVSPEDMIKSMIESNVSVFLHGPSSEGKSARVKQFDPDCVIIYLRNATPDSLNGKSVYNQSTGEMIDVPPTWFVKMEEKCENEPNKLHIVFFDEFTNALPAIQGFAFNIILDKEIDGKWKLPNNCRIVAAGNEVKDSLAAYEMVEPVYNRFAHVNIKTTVDNWVAWAITDDSVYERVDYYEPNPDDKKMHPAIVSFVSKFGESVLRTPFTGEEPNADPRRWELASKILYATNNPKNLLPIVGHNLTLQFIDFCSGREKEIDRILRGDYDRDIKYMDVASKMSIINELSTVSESGLSAARNKVKLFGKEFLTAFDCIWVGNDQKRFEVLSELAINDYVR